MHDISVLVSSRGRFDDLKYFVSSLYDTANRPDKVEVIVRLDTDDVSSVKRMDELPNVKWVVGESLGVQKSYVRLYETFLKSRGEYVMIGADDFIMNTIAWDDMIRPYFGQIRVVHTRGEVTSFIHRSIPEVWHKFANSYACDIIYKLIALELGIYVRRDELDVVHKHLPSVTVTTEPYIHWLTEIEDTYRIINLMGLMVNTDKFVMDAPLALHGDVDEIMKTRSRKSAYPTQPMPKIVG
jgi:hypothetical protein